MKTFWKICHAALLACALGGCASAGIGTIKTLDDTALAVRIQAGATTKAELKRALGPAAVVSFDSGYEVWVYKDEEGAPRLLRYVPIVNIGAAMIPNRTRELVVLIGPDGVVRKFRVHRS